MARTFRVDRREDGSLEQFGQFALRGRFIKGPMPDDPNWETVAVVGPVSPDDTYVVLTIPQYEAALREAAAREREACAKIVEDASPETYLSDGVDVDWDNSIAILAARIRARAADAAGGEG
jgi:hypothetical protein